MKFILNIPRAVLKGQQTTGPLLVHASGGTAVLNGLADHESGVVNYREEVACKGVNCVYNSKHL